MRGDTGTREGLSDVLTGDEWGDEALETMREKMPNKQIGMIANPEHLPRKENTVTLDHSKTVYIASSSVFVTGGAINPTLTIAALSLKAADHIHEDLT